ncbi:hypothetical protein [Methylocaldum sp.]|uniref:hypothetical protein n=1 Tax=Methylocaldum sp. TaxID=1969727 RepID=UPI002D2CB9F9|nr:hypothetical protein [Methylocaldum sp.]HYE35472.1 hypothetical protein [Methylocaldum sp.]
MMVPLSPDEKLAARRHLLNGGALCGKRTYLLGGLTAVSALILWLTGDMALGEAAKQILEGLSFIALRAGMGTAGPPATLEAVEVDESQLRAVVAETLRQIQDPEKPSP